MKTQKRLVIYTLLFAATVLGSLLVKAEEAQPQVAANERVIAITAKKFEYSMSEITVKKGEAVVLELTSLDRVHGFNLPDFGIRTNIVPGTVTRVRITPTKAGRFNFHCDVFCGEGHEQMSGTLIVTE